MTALDDCDDSLGRLFAEARETLPTDDFLEHVALRISQARRRSAIKRMAVTAAGAALALAATPYIATGSLTVADHLGTSLPAVGNALTSPIGWLGSLALAAWGMRRTQNG